jgi:hypothetical protein
MTGIGPSRKKVKADAESGAEPSLEAMIHHASAKMVKAAAQHEALTEELALALLARRDIPPAALEAVSKRGELMKHRKVSLAVAQHPKTPRHISLPLVRRLYTFDLMQLALTPRVQADLKLVADEVIVNRVESISAGERLALARQGSARVAAALLLDVDLRVVEAGLNNPRMTEAWVVKTIAREDASLLLLDVVSRHPKWSVRREVQIALLRNANTPFGRLLQIASLVPWHILDEVLKTSKLTPEIHNYLIRMLEAKSSRPGRSLRSDSGLPPPELE